MTGGDWEDGMLGETATVTPASLDSVSARSSTEMSRTDYQPDRYSFETVLIGICCALIVGLLVGYFASYL